MNRLNFFVFMFFGIFSTIIHSGSGLVPSAWADVGSSSAAPSGKKFVFRIRGEPETLDWNRAHTLVEGALLINLMEGLVSFDAQSKIIPALAESWNTLLDGKIYTFKLRHDVKWSDGVPLKAQDFVYSWKRLLSPMTAASYAYFLFDIEGAAAFNQGKLQDFGKVGIKALDDWTLQVTLTQPVAHWINIPAFWATFPVRQDVVEKYGTAWETPGRMVVLGPYCLESHDVNSKWVLRANRSYYGIRGNVDEVTALIVKDDALAMSLYEANQIDLLSDLSTKDPDRLTTRQDFKVFRQLKTVYLGLSVEKYPLSNVNFRRALAMALNKSKIRTVLSSSFQSATTLVPPGMLGYSPKGGLPFDPVQAKKELGLSGFELRPGFVLEYILPDWDKSSAIGQWIQSDLKENLGIDVKLQKMENKAYRAQLDLQASPLFEGSWTADYPDSDSFLSLYLSTSGNSRTAWKNDRYDEGVQNGRRSRTPLERERLYMEQQKILLQDEAVLIPLYYEPNLALIRPRVKTVELNSLGYLYLRRLNVGT